MKINHFIAILLSSFGWIIGWQLASEGVSFWITILIAFVLGFGVFLLLSEDLFKKKKEKKWK